MSRGQISIGRSLVLIASLCFVFYLCFATETARFRRIHERMTLELEYVAAKAPDGVPRSDWNEAVMVTQIACSNVCFSPQHIEISQFQRFCDELQKRREECVTFRTLNWIWSRLAQTGPHGTRYVQRNKMRFDDIARPYLEERDSDSRNSEEFRRN